MVRHFGDEPDIKWLNRIGGSYNELNGYVTIPYKELQRHTMFTDEYYFQILRYAVDNEAAVKAISE